MLQLLSLFSGIGAFEKALDRLNIAYELVNYCEIDKYASKSYAAVHNVSESLNLGDVTKVDTSKLPENINFITYGFPCQDISIAGKQKGLYDQNGEKTRSGLFFEALRIIEDTKPKVAIAENVKNLTGNRFKEQFEIVLDSLESAGYNIYWSVLNAKDYSVPQSRERVFIVSVRKDVDTGLFKFPEPVELKLRLKDILEAEVAEKYYMPDKYISYTSDGHTEPQVKQIGNCCPTRTRDNPNQGRIYDTEGISPALNCMGGGNRQPCVPVIPKTICLNSKGGRGGVEGLQPSLKDRIYDSNGIATACTTSDFFMPHYTDGLRIRKLTPLECWRLMGFDDQDFYKAEKVNSNTQLYKQAGNSIVVNVLEAILNNLVEAKIF